MSPSLRPHGLQPSRLLCPRNSPGKSTAVDCHSLLDSYQTTLPTINSYKLWANYSTATIWTHGEWSKASRSQRGTDFRKRRLALGSNQEIFFNDFCPRVGIIQIETQNLRGWDIKGLRWKGPGSKPKRVHVQFTQFLTDPWPTCRQGKHHADFSGCLPYKSQI